MNPQDAPLQLKIGPWEFVPGVTRGHFFSLLGASLFTIGLLSVIGNMQPYFFREVLGVPDAQVGRLAGNLATFNEIFFLIAASFVGAASDKLGRRGIYALGFALMAVAYVLYPLATEPGQLFAFRAIFALGAACVSAMIAAVIADYAVERTRGRLVGICFFLNGIGVALLIGVGGLLPKILENMGVEPQQAARCAYWTIAALCVIPLVIVAFGLQPGAPARVEAREPLLSTLRIGLRAAREPRVLLAYLSAFVSRGDLAVLSTFFLQWLTLHGVSKGMTTADAQAAGLKFFVIAQLAATLWAVVVILFVDKFDRALAVGLAMTMAAIAYLTVGYTEDPLSPAMYFAAVLLGIGEMSGILASQSLVGQVSADRGRGAIIGVFSMFGAAGILSITFFGGQLFDHWRPSAPYIVIGVADALLAAIAFWIYFRTRERPSQA
jgi:MFS family permease